MAVLNRRGSAAQIACSLVLAALFSGPAVAQIEIGGTADAPLKTVENSYRWLDSKRRNLSGLRLSNFDIVVDRNAVRIEDGQSDVIIRNGIFRLSKPTSGSNLPVAVEVVNGSDVLIENVKAYGFRMEPVQGRYQNGDCFSGERTSRNVTLRNTLASDCSDGGYDFKTIGLRLEDTVAEDASKGYRIWGQATASTITCRRWLDGCIQTNAGVAGFPTTMVVDTLILDPHIARNATNFGVSWRSTLIIKSCIGRLSSGKVIYWQKDATWENTKVVLCGVEVVGQTDALLRAQITAQIAADARRR